LLGEGGNVGITGGEDNCTEVVGEDGRRGEECAILWEWHIMELIIFKECRGDMCRGVGVRDNVDRVQQ